MENAEADQTSPPFALPYGVARSSAPGLLMALAVTGICIAALGLLYAAFETLSVLTHAMMARTTPTFYSQTVGELVVSICEIIVGLALAAMLMTASIGLLRLRPWSRKMILGWAWIYLFSSLIFLALQILIVVPGEVAALTKMMQSMTITTPPATPMPAPLVTPPAGPTTSPTISTSAPAAGPTTTTFTFSASTTAVSVWPHQAPGPAPAQMMSTQMMGMMRISYIAMAIGKTVVCLIFPIVTLILMQLQSIRSALTTDFAASISR